MMYFVPEKIEDISSEVKGHKYLMLAGGTDIMVMKKENMIDEDTIIVDISAFRELKSIREENGLIIIGSLVTMSQLASSEIVNEKIPALSDAARSMGSPLIRNLATIGGNLANSNPAGDTIPPLYAFESELVIQSGYTSKTVNINDFCTGPCANSLFNGELIHSIRIPVRESYSSAFKKLGPRKALAISKVSLAAQWLMESGRIKDIKIAMGAVGPKCIRAKRTEELLKGEPLKDEVLRRAADTIKYDACPIDDFRSSKNYRRKMLGVLLNDVLKKS